MNQIKSHKDLKVWQESMSLVLVIYNVTECFPKHETSMLKGLSPKGMTNSEQHVTDLIK